MKFINQGFDHVEFTVNQIAPHQKRWEDMGFEVVADQVVESIGARQVVMAQGFVRLLMTQYVGSTVSHAQPGYTFLKAHGEGICVLGVEVEDASQAFQETVARGARPALEPKWIETKDGSVCVSEIFTPADFRYRFVQRKLAS